MRVLVLQGGAAGFGCLASVLLARRLGPERFGEFSSALAFGTYAAQLVRFGTDRTLVQDLVRGGAESMAMLASSLLMRTVAFGMVLAGVVPLAIALNKDVCSFPIVVLAVSLAALDLQAWYDARGAATLHSLYLLLQKVVLLLILQVCTWYPAEGLGLLGASLAWLGASVVFLWLQGGQYLQVFLWVASNDFHGILRGARALIAVNLPVFVSALLCLCFGTLNQVLVCEWAGGREGGIFAAGWQYASASCLVVGHAARLAVPRLAQFYWTRPPASELRSKLRMETVHLLVLVSPFALFGLFFPEAVLAFLFPGRALDGAALLQCMAGYSVLVAAGVMPGQILVFQGRRRTYLACVLAGAVSAVVACGFLIPRLGALGGAVSLLLSHGLSILLYWVAVLGGGRCATNP